jgi:hypothetical protein
VGKTKIVEWEVYLTRPNVMMIEWVGSLFVGTGVRKIQPQHLPACPLAVLQQKSPCELLAVRMCKGFAVGSLGKMMA